MALGGLHIIRSCNRAGIRIGIARKVDEGNRAELELLQGLVGRNLADLKGTFTLAQ